MRVWRVLLLLVLLLELGTMAEEDEEDSTEENANDGICYSMDIRNRIEAFRLLSGCRVVEGFVQIVLLDKTSEEDFRNVSFPQLREITRYLLLFRVAGLRSLGALFPNLAVIRGAALFRDYALVVFELFALRHVALASLVRIERGGVVVSKNDNLCFVETVDWARLAPAGEVVVTGNGAAARCADEERRVCAQSGCPLGPPRRPPRPAPKGGPSAGGEEGDAGAGQAVGCWGPGICQRVPALHRCSAQCLGGCSGPGPRRCFACRHVLSLDGSCVDSCPPGSFLYLERRCVTAEQCRQMRDWDQATVLRLRERGALPSSAVTAPSETSDPAADGLAHALHAPRFWTFNGSCVSGCPQGWEEAAGGGCQRCGGRCRRVCPGAMVDSLATAQELRGCTAIDGPLVLHLPTAGPELVAELNRSLADIEEIADYLKVWRSFSLLSLGFLARLRVIGGRSLLDRYALKVVENQNLRRLWEWGAAQGDAGRFRILNGSVLFHANPKLCRAHIDRLLGEAGLNASLQVIQSNGEHEVCRRVVLRAGVARRYAKAAVVHWEPPPPEEEEPTEAEAPSLLGFLVYFREAPAHNATPSSGREVCGAEGWQVQDAGRRDALEARLAARRSPPALANPNPSPDARRWLSAPLTKLKPYTQYAFYVTTYSVTSSGASSDIVYFTTLPAQPSMPLRFTAEALANDADGAQTEPVLSVQEEGEEDEEGAGESVRLRWLPPRAPNGLLTHYVVRGALLPDLPEPGRDYCASPPPPQPPLLPPPPPPLPPPSTVASTAGLPPSCPPNANQYYGNATKGPCKCKKEPEPSRTQHDFMAHCSIAALGISDKRGEECSRFVQDSLEALPLLPDPGHLFENPQLDFPTEEKEEKDHIWDVAGISKVSTDSESQRKFLFHFEVAASASGLVVRGLPPFARVALSLSACRAPDSQPRSACSSAALAVARTLPRRGADAVGGGEAPRLGPPRAAAGDRPRPLAALWAAWTPPRSPNGRVLFYLLQWRRVDTDSPAQTATECVNAASVAAEGGAGALLRELPAGARVRARVRARSQGGEGPWTEWSSAVQLPPPTPRAGHAADGDRGAARSPARGSHARTRLVAALVAAAALLAACACAAGAVLWARAARRRRLRQLIASVNPDYDHLATDPLYDETWEVAAERVQLLREVGRGSFGCVAEALLLPAAAGDAADASPLRCAAKALADGAPDGRSREQTLSEAAAMKAFREGAHLVRLLGVVSRARPPLVLMELMARGDLKRVLRAARRAPSWARPHTRHLLAAAAQVADGMAFLEARKFVHRDVAARNCMVSAEGVVKVGDFGLARDVYETDYYRSGARGLLPVRWMAPESLADGVFSARSDAWAFGVVLWEAATLAQQPYQGLANEQVVELVLGGGVLAPPAGCAPALARLMELCWRWRPAERPAFLRLVHLIEEEALALPLPLQEARDGAGEEEWLQEAAAEAEAEDGDAAGLGVTWVLGGGGAGAEAVAGAGAGLPAAFRERAFAFSPAAAALRAQAAGAEAQCSAQPALPRSRAPQMQPDCALYVAPRDGEEARLLLPLTLPPSPSPSPSPMPSPWPSMSSAESFTSDSAAMVDGEEELQT